MNLYNLQNQYFSKVFELTILWRLFYMQHWAVQSPSTCMHSIAVFPSKSNFIASFSVSWIEAINYCTFFINIRKIQIIHLQIVGTESSYILKSFDKYMFRCSLIISQYCSILQYCVCFCFVLSCYSTTHEGFPVSI